MPWFEDYSVQIKTNTFWDKRHSRGMWKLKRCFGFHNIRRCTIHNGHEMISQGVLAYQNRIPPLCSLEELRMGQVAQLPIKSFCSLKVTQKSITYDSNRLGIFVGIVKLLNCRTMLSCNRFNLPLWKLQK